ncbi:tetratricopeptide repeat protein [Kiritimatiella glycovorans]|uniref:Tetratricopeptide repeat protein n=1 Tax=Kiritimatiella glycovorans TaxID=1307763 RepID=A0A0G3EJP9_9BACT|nr:tetratricopeptide repeat protein [Kiritimatiella glycovorans]AKJ65672.1 tetratricopeptide repeat protein [Kiritimatiella glycovorans]
MKKINYRVLIPLLVVVAAVVTGVTLLQRQQSPDALEHRGDALLEEGSAEAALDLYMRALRSEPGNPELRMKAVRAVESLPPLSIDRALDHSRFMLRSLHRVLDIDPMHGPARRRLLDFYFEWAVAVRDRAVWQHLKEAAHESVAAARIMSREPSPLTLKYRGVAELKTGEPVPVEEAERRIGKTVEDLVTRFPDDRLVLMQAAEYHRRLARRWQMAGQPVRAGERLDRAESLLRDAVASSPDDLRLRIGYVRTLWTNPEPGPSAATARVELDRRLGGAEDNETLRRAARLYLSLQDRRDESLNLEWTAEELLRRAVDRHPDDLLSRLMLVEISDRRGGGDTEEDLLKLWRQRRAIRPGVPAMIAAHVRPVAGSRLADLHLRLAERAPDAEERQRRLRRADEVLQSLARFNRRDGLLPMLRGKRHLIAGEVRQAALALHEAERRYENPPVDVVYLAARAMMQAGNYGAARSRLERLARHPRALEMERVHADRVEVALRQGRTADALRVLEHARKRFPDSEPLDILYLRALDRRRGESQAEHGPEPALEIVERLRSAAVERGRGLAAAVRTLEAAGRLGAARELLRERRAQAPSDRTAFAERLRIEERHAGADAARGWVEEVLAGQPDFFPALAAKVRLTGDPAPMEAFEDAVLAAENRVDDLWKLYGWRLERGEESAASLLWSRLKQRRPDSQAVLREDFRRALESEEWNRAGSLAVAAEKDNLDLASGAAWRGRIALARQDYPEAVHQFDLAVERMPVSPRLWKEYGEARRGNGQPDAAEKAFRRALELRPQYTAAVWSLRTLYTERGNYAEAVRLMEQAIGRFDERPFFRHVYLDDLARAGKVREAIRGREAWRRDEPGRAENVHALARLHLRQGQTEKAREIMAPRMESGATEYEDVEVMAAVHAAAGEYEQGVALWDRWIQDGRGNTVQARIARARYLAGFADASRVRAAFEDAVEAAGDGSSASLRAFGGWLNARGDPAAALARYRAAAAAGDREAALRVIDLHLQLDQADRAGEALAQFRRRFGLTPAALVLEGRLQEKRGDLEGAEHKFNRAAEEAPWNPNMYLQRARFFVRNEKGSWMERAESDLKKALRLQPAFADAQLALASFYLNPAVDRPEQAAAELRSLIRRHPGDPRAYRVLASLLLGRGRESELEQLLDTAREQFPGAESWKEIRTEAAWREGRRDEALTALREAWERRGDAVSLNAWVRALITVDPGGALRAMESNAETVRENPALRLMYGIVLAAEGRAAKGRAELVAALRATTDRAALLDATAMLRSHLEDGDRVAVLKSWWSGSGDPAAGWSLGRALTDSGRASAAVAPLTRALESEDLPEWLEERLRAERAAALIAAGRPADAEQELETLVREHPGNPHYHNDLAWLRLEELDRPHDALPAAEEACRISSDNDRVRAELRHTLGRIHRVLGNREQARFYLEKSLEDHPTGHARSDLRKLDLESP